MPTLDDYLKLIADVKANNKKLNINFDEIPKDIDKNALASSLSENLNDNYKSTIQDRVTNNKSFTIDFGEIANITQPTKLSSKDIKITPQWTPPPEEPLSKEELKLLHPPVDMHPKQFELDKFQMELNLDKEGLPTDLATHLLLSPAGAVNTVKFLITPQTGILSEIARRTSLSQVANSMADAIPDTKETQTIKPIIKHLAPYAGLYDTPFTMAGLEIMHALKTIGKATALKEKYNYFDDEQLSQALVRERKVSPLIGTLLGVGEMTTDFALASAFAMATKTGIWSQIKDSFIKEASAKGHPEETIAKVSQLFDDAEPILRDKISDFQYLKGLFKAKRTAQDWVKSIQQDVPKVSMELNPKPASDVKQAATEILASPIKPTMSVNKAQVEFMKTMDKVDRAVFPLAKDQNGVEFGQRMRDLATKVEMGKPIEEAKNEFTSLYNEFKTTQIQEEKVEVPKKLWEMSKSEADKLPMSKIEASMPSNYFSAIKSKLEDSDVELTPENIHAQAIETAIFNGEDVPDSVLKDYPSINKTVLQAQKLVHDFVPLIKKKLNITSLNLGVKEDLEELSITADVLKMYEDRGLTKGLSFKEWVGGSGDNIVREATDQYLEIRTPKQKAQREILKSSIEDIEEYKDIEYFASGAYFDISKFPKFQQFVNKNFTHNQGLDPRVMELMDRSKNLKKAFEYESTVVGQKLYSGIQKYGGMAKEALANYLLGNDTVDKLPLDIQKYAELARQGINKLQQKLLDHGVMSQAVKQIIEASIGKYLTQRHKLFADKEWFPTDVQREDMAINLMEKKPKTFGKLTKEQMINSLKSFEQKAKAKRFSGRKNPTVSQNHFIRKKQWNATERAYFGTIEDPIYQYLDTVNTVASLAMNSEYLDLLSTIPGIYHDVEPPMELGDFRQLPDSSNWGKMKGKWIDRNLYDFLNEVLVKPEGIYYNLLIPYLINPFKITKTVLSIPSHMRNLIGNTMFQILHKVSPANPFNWKYYSKAIDTVSNSKGSKFDEYRLAIMSGVSEGDFTQEELTELKKIAIDVKPDNLFELLKQVGDKTIGTFKKAYALEDTIPKLAAWYRYRDKGLDPISAGKKVLRYSPNYAGVSRAVKWLRKYPVFGAFISFPAETGRVIYNAFKDGLEQKDYYLLAAAIFGVTLPFLLKEGSDYLFDVTDKENEALKNVLPAYRRNGVIMAWRNAQNQLKMFDLSYIYPTGSYMQILSAISRGDMQGLADAGNLLDAPVIMALNVIKEGEDQAYNKSIRNPYDPFYKQAMDTGLELVKEIYLPSSMPVPSIKALLHGEVRPGTFTGYNFKPLLDAYIGWKDRFGQKKDVTEEIKNFLTGIRTFTFVPERVASEKIAQLAADRQKLMDQKINPQLPKYEKDRLIQEKITRRDIINKEIKKTMEARTVLSQMKERHSK